MKTCPIEMVELDDEAYGLGDDPHAFPPKLSNFESSPYYVK
jgi:hypothetical protein